MPSKKNSHERITQKLFERSKVERSEKEQVQSILRDT